MNAQQNPFTGKSSHCHKCDAEQSKFLIETQEGLILFDKPEKVLFYYIVLHKGDATYSFPQLILPLNFLYQLFCKEKN